ncbi:MAG: hypothetical protein IJ323_00940 [Clostridia bacterium]|nr:hypothetical protein [Clostridia bacterium]
MKIDEYLALYEEYSRHVKELAEALELMKAGMDEKEGETLFLPDDPYGLFKKQYLKKLRILEKAQGRIARAMCNIKDSEVVRFLTYKYFCSLTNEQVGEAMNYSERQLYRVKRRAKDALYEKLLDEMPTPKRWEKCRVYRRLKKVPKRRYRKHAYADRIK